MDEPEIYNAGAHRDGNAQGMTKAGYTNKPAVNVRGRRNAATGNRDN